MLVINLRRILLALATICLGLAASTAMAQHRGGGGHSSRGYSGHGHGGHHGGFSSSFYGGNYGRGHSGFSISIGGGYPFGFGGFGFGGLGGYGYGGYGYPYSSYSSLYRGYSPYYSSSGLGYYRTPSYRYVPADPYQSGYRYGTAPAASYGVPGYSSEYAHQPSNDPNSSAENWESSSDLRPGMILPDGSTVISIGPVGAAVPEQSSP